MTNKEMMIEAVEFLANRRGISRQMMIDILSGEYGKGLQSKAAQQVADLLAG